VRLSAEISKLAGRLVLTCHQRFGIARSRRLAAVNIMSILVGDYMQGELNELPRQRKIDIDTIPERVRTFIRNPHICSVALDLLDRLARSTA
jgi:hypothetical protein